MKEYYKLDSRRLSFGEYWSVTRVFELPIVWVFKILGVRLDQKRAGAPPHRLLEVHFKKMEALRDQNPPKKIESFDDLAELVSESESRHMDYMISRGVYVRMSEEEVESARRKMPATAPAS